jgi:4-aminobutyrate aminotransferase
MTDERRLAGPAQVPVHDDDLLSRHRAVLPTWMPLYYDEPIEIVSGSGRRVTDAAGRTYLDFFGGVLTTMLGYDLPELRDALERQLRTGVLHTSTLYLIRSQVELAEKIARLSGIPDARVFFTNSGTEANEAALLVATNYRRSNQILALRNSYHGRTYATMGATGVRSWSASPLSPLRVSFLHSGERLRGLLAGRTDDEFVDAAVADLREVIATTTSGDVACLIAEPIQGVGGYTYPPDGLFAGYRKVLDEHGVLFIADEVQTGWGRTGEHFWGYQAHGITPDLLTFAKGVGNGLALAGVVGRAEVLNAVSAVSFSTFGGNPLATAGGNAVVDYVLAHDVQGNAARVGGLLLDGLRPLVDRHPIVGDVRGKGLMLGIEFVEPGTTNPNGYAMLRVFEECRRRGLLVGKGGLYGNVIRLGPPLTLTGDEAREGLAILAAAIAAVGP